MTDRISREEFNPDEHLATFQHFDCGEEPYQTPVSDWIKDANPSDSVVNDMVTRDTSVWLYRNDNNDIVGFGSLGTTKWYLSPTDDKRSPVLIIPNVAVAKRFWGLPVGDTYADQIIDDLREEAKNMRTKHRQLVLCVHPDNLRAIRFYRRVGFKIIEPPQADGHLRMGIAIE